MRQPVRKGTSPQGVQAPPDGVGDAAPSLRYHRCVKNVSTLSHRPTQTSSSRRYIHALRDFTRRNIASVTTLICTIPRVVTQGREWAGQHLSIFMVLDAFLRIGTAPELVRLPVLHLAFPGTIEHRLTAGPPLHDWIFHSARRAFHPFVNLSSHPSPQIAWPLVLFFFLF